MTNTPGQPLVLVVVFSFNLVRQVCSTVVLFFFNSDNAFVFVDGIFCSSSPYEWRYSMSQCLVAGGTPIGSDDNVSDLGIVNINAFWTADYTTIDAFQWKCRYIH